MSASYTVLLVTDVPENSEELKQGLYGSGVTTIHELDSSENFLKALNDISVDFIVLDVDKPSHELFGRLSIISEHCPMPIVCFSNHSDSELIESSVKAGVTAYIVDGKSADRVKPIIEVAYLRFKECQSVRKELMLVKDKLSERATIEKAKGLLIENKGLSEDEAYRALRKMAMDQGKRISVIAHEVCGVFLGLQEQ